MTLYKILHEDDYINEIPSQLDTNLISNIKEKLQSKNVSEVDVVTRALKELLSFGWGRVSSRYLAIMVITLLQTFQFPSWKVSTTPLSVILSTGQAVLCPQSPDPQRCRDGVLLPPPPGISLPGDWEEHSADRQAGLIFPESHCIEIRVYFGGWGAQVHEVDGQWEHQSCALCL